MKVFRFSNVKTRQKKYSGSVSLDILSPSETPSVASSCADSTYSALTVPNGFHISADSDEESSLLNMDKEDDVLTMIVCKPSAPPPLPVSFNNWSK